MVQLTLTEKEALCQNLAAHLSRLRRLLHLSQARFGELAGISRARIIQVESGKAHLSWGQLTSVMFVCIGDLRTREYLYANNVVGPRFLQYLQQKDANIPPQTNILVNEELMAIYRDQAKNLPKKGGVVVFSKDERQAFCEYLLDLIPELRRVLQMSQATLAELAGISRARLIQLEKKKVRLSWSQMTSILCVCMANIRAKEYIYANNVLPPRFLQYIQQKDANIFPDTNIFVSPSVIMSYHDMLKTI